MLAAPAPLVGCLAGWAQDDLRKGHVRRPRVPGVPPATCHLPPRRPPTSITGNNSVKVNSLWFAIYPIPLLDYSCTFSVYSCNKSGNLLRRGREWLIIVRESPSFVPRKRFEET